MKTSYAVRRPVYNEYLVRERDRRRWREVGLVMLVVLPLAGALLSYTWIHLEERDTGYRIDRMERRLEQLLESERRLRFVAARLQSPERLETIAVERLGLAAPRFDQLLFVEAANGANGAMGVSSAARAEGANRD